MELALLNSSFKRQKPIENWGSLIWTERFSANGDFELVSNNIAEILSLLPVGGPTDPPCVVAIRDSNVPMVVENHKLETPKNSAPQIVTTGRSFETVLDRRVTMRTYESDSPRVPWVVDAASPSDAAWFVADQIVTVGIADIADIIPEIVILDDISDVWPGGASKYAVEPKELYAWMMDTLALGKHGLKATLPSLSGDQIALSIYNGANRTETVVFESRLEQFDSAVYLLSLLGYKNVMITATQNGVGWGSTMPTWPSGLARRVAYQDLSQDITLAVGADLDLVTTNKSKVSLEDYLQTVLFSGEISNLEAAQYGTDYFLGDIVKLSGDYGMTQDVRISEFVRTHDATGVKAYPTFEAVTP